MEQRITRAKARIAEADVPFETPGRGRARGAARGRRGDGLSDLQRGLFGRAASEAPARAPLCDEAIRLARLLLRLFPAEPEIMGLDGAACCCSMPARAARFDADGAIVLLEDQDRGAVEPRA